MNTPHLSLLLSIGFFTLQSLSAAAQTRFDLGGKPRIESATPSDRSNGSTEYTEAEQNRYLALVSKGYSQLLTDSLRLAELTFKEATDFLPSHPSNAEIFYQLGQISERRGNYHTSSDYYRKSIRINENLAKSYERRGIVNLVLKDYSTALGCFSSFLKLKPANPQVLFYMGYAYQQQGKLDNAMAKYQQVLDQEPMHASANTAVAVIEAGKGHHDAAIEIMDKLITHNPKSASLYEMRGTFEMESGKNQMALYDFNKSIELLPNNPTAYLNRAVLHGRSGQKTLAEEDITKAQELGADETSVERARTSIARRKQKVTKTP